MNILVVSHEFPPLGGGGANACYYLTKGFVELGNEVTVVTANYQGLSNREKVNGVTVIRVNAKRKNKEHSSLMEMMSYLVHAFPIVNRMAKQRSFDICLVFFGIPSGPLGYWIKKRYGIPYIIRFGGGDIPGAQERFAFVYKLVGPFLKRIWNSSDALVANSGGLQQTALGFYNRKKIEIISNGVDINYFTPIEDKGDVFSEVNILFVSRLIEGKGLQFVIPKLREIKRSSGREVKLTVVGDGPYRRQLESLALCSHVEDCVLFVGAKSKEEILEFYQKADIFILPSKKEGMPNVVLEAMACGLPIIMTPCGGSDELVIDNGVIVGQNDFAHELGKILQNMDLVKKMAMSSRERAVKYFSWDKTVKRYINLFRQHI